MPPRRLGPTAVSRAFPSLARSILTEIYRGGIGKLHI
jgi:hypothetical protein